METDHRQLELALQAAQMYYYQNLPMKRIAVELQVSHSTISRLLSWARQQGLIEIRINDFRGRSSPLEEVIKLKYKISAAKVVPVSEMAGENVWLDRVAKMAANYLSSIMTTDMVLGVAWGTTVNQIAANLTPKPLINVNVVQLNGGENITNLGNNYAGELITRFANNYDARAHLFSVPAFFDYVETKEVMWRERSIQRILEWQKRAETLLFSVGSFEGNTVSAVYLGEHLEEKDYAEMNELNIVGDIANVMIRPDGSYQNIPINERVCAPDLSLFRNVDRAICVVSGHSKVKVLHAALIGGYITDLIIDEPTARKLVDRS